MMLLYQSANGATHRDDIIVGMRREHNDALGVGQRTLRTSAVVGIRLAAGPSGDGVLQLVEHGDVDQSGLSVELLHQVPQSVVFIVFCRELQHGFPHLAA